MCLLWLFKVNGLCCKMEYYSKCITNLIVGENQLAYDNLKLSKMVFVLPHEKVRYYDLKLRLLKNLGLKDKIYKNCDQLILIDNIDFSTRNEYLNLISEYIEKLPFTTK